MCSVQTFVLYTNRTYSDILLTVHLSLIVATNQLNAQNLVL